MVKGKNGQIQVQEPDRVIHGNRICPESRRNRPDGLAILVGRKEETLLTGEWQEFEVNSVFNSFYGQASISRRKGPWTSTSAWTALSQSQTITG